MKRTTPSQPGSPNDRSGVTLTEVLMSLMIMSIGISSVAVLFPISVLRSVQATQMTNAAILKHNAKALLQMRPEIVFDPDGDGNLDEHVGRLQESRYIVDPYGYYSMIDAGMPFGANPPARDLADFFGNVDDLSTPARDLIAPPPGFTGLPRFDGGIRIRTGLDPTVPEQARAAQLLASELTRLGDGWNTVVDTTVDSLVPDGAGRIVGAVVSPKIDLFGVTSSATTVPGRPGPQLIDDPELTRVVIFTADGRMSAALPLTTLNVGTRTVYWTEDLDQSGSFDPGEDLNRNGVFDNRPLPVAFFTPTGFQAGRILIQTRRTNDFNWLLTVRRGSDGQVRGVDVVVTFSNGVTPDDERMYPATFVRGADSAFIVARGGLLQNGNAAEPLIKRGRYVFDSQNARWYRIRDFTSVGPLTIGAVTGPGIRLDLETPVLETSTLTGGNPVGWAMFLPGVVDVYPMGAMKLPDNL